MCSNLPRRALLGGFGSICLVGLAGCNGGPESSRGATDVLVHNKEDMPRTVDLIVTQRGNESTRIDTHFEIGANDQTEINNKVLMGSDYDVDVSFTDTTRESPYSETQEWNDAGKSLHIILNDQVVFTVQMG